ncbi:hypothetical protein N7462_002300 [Penicillium macrosclerotiorum]|uniref:uncharacterized protein n=1 Tax=Penicillium macrosclerotiorum TaxID=303699 RepID=UPI002547DD34|nr:uncharacterized protein N7462_002300 [Penicillium macrosclerotiorum]KAJ5692877.1 hypothetical protein N7462_002300 [Penicillium macrosclerotiorum]
MAMQYFNQIKNRRRSSQILKPPNPVLTAEDEAFLQQVTSQPEQRPPSDSQASLQNQGALAGSSQRPILEDGPQNVPLPASPAEEFGKKLGEEERKTRDQAENVRTQSEPTQPQDAPGPEKKKRWSGMFWKKGPDLKKEKEIGTADQGKSQSPAPASRTTSSPENKEDAQKDQEDMTDILERLNLAADNNRVFSISDETQELLRKFKLIFKDLVNGVPTAYQDLEMLLTNGNRQLQDTYTKLPSFMQKLIEKLPERWTESLAPEMLAVASERAAQSGVNMENVGKAAAAAEKMGLNVPSLKELVSKPAAIVGMLRSIMAFLRARFPAALGMNVLWSLALFILLFVLWYCHKRGREVRLENERLVTEEEIQKLNENAGEGRIRPTETLTTTAPRGAPADEVRAGVRRAEEARSSTAVSVVASEPGEVNRSDENTRPAPVPTRSKSRLSIWSRSKPEPIPTNITPYPGT